MLYETLTKVVRNVKDILKPDYVSANDGQATTTTIGRITPGPVTRPDLSIPAATNSDLAQDQSGYRRPDKNSQAFARAVPSG